MRIPKGFSSVSSQASRNRARFAIEIDTQAQPPFHGHLRIAERLVRKDVRLTRLLKSEERVADARVVVFGKLAAAAGLPPADGFDLAPATRLE